MDRRQDPQIIAARLAELEPPEGFASPPSPERAHVYYQRHRNEHRLRGAWDSGYVDLFLGRPERQSLQHARALATAAAMRPGELLMIGALQPGQEVREANSVRWLLVARLAEMTLQDGMARAHLASYRVFTDVPPEALPQGVDDALRSSAGSRRFITSLDVVLHPALAPAGG